MNEVIKILVADDDEQMQIALHTSLSRAGYAVTIVRDGAQALAKLEQEEFQLVVSDQCMPNMNGLELLATAQEKEITTPIIIITAHGNVSQAVDAMRRGAADFIQKPFSHDELSRVVERVLSPEAIEFRQAGKSKGVGRPIVTNDSRMIKILEICESVAKSDATVLIAGESGTGKELIARLLHSESSRSSQPFIAVNCAALPEALLESELFGHEKGSFTGALARKLGKFELAHGGTILLDEISEMALPLQAKLLRVLQEREVDRVGGKDPIKVDVRVVATTNRRLEDSVARGEFRSDLYYRLNVIPITLPALRQRPGDIELLVRHFMKKFLGNKAPELNPQVLQELVKYPWPGNIRELQNAVERAGILANGNSPKPQDFFLNTFDQTDQQLSQGPGLASKIVTDTVESQPEVAAEDAITAQPQPLTSAENTLRIAPGMTVAEMEKRLIFETLRSTNNNRTEAAKMLDISIRTLRNKLHEYNGTDQESSS